MKEHIKEILKKPPHHLKKPEKTIKVGTSGIRTIGAELLRPVCRASLFAILRSQTTCSKQMGLMITASHNPIKDNGVKFVDFSGDNLSFEHEEYCNELMNAEDVDLYDVYCKINRKLGNLHEIDSGPTARIAVGRDTRDTGEYLLDGVLKVLNAFEVDCIDYGIVTTPQFTYCVRMNNELEAGAPPLKPSAYIEHLCKNFKMLVECTGKRNPFFKKIDCANGVGGLALNHINDHLSKIGMSDYQFEVINIGINKQGEPFQPNPNLLNMNCGADYVNAHRKVPENLNLKGVTPETVIGSLDGDADRLVLFRRGERLEVIDGDYITVFLTKILYEQTKGMDLTLGAVLSHYSNTAAVRCLSKYTKTVDLSKTGIKFFIIEARRYDMSVFAEPNGHASAHFSRKARNMFKSSNNKVLIGISELLDPVVGDGLSNLLIFSALFDKESFMELMKSYTPLKLRNIPVRVKDKNVLEMNSETDIKSPFILKQRVKELEEKYRGRAFVRPSGTEDLIRIFAENETRESTDKFALEIAEFVYEICGGVGPHPEIKYN